MTIRLKAGFKARQNSENSDFKRFYPGNHSQMVFRVETTKKFPGWTVLKSPDPKYSIFCGIDKDKKDDLDKNIWYEDLPEKFECKCGKTKFNLKYIKEGMHSLLGYKKSKFSGNEAIERSYTLGALEKIVEGFKNLLDDEKSVEEDLQKYIEKNPILLSIFTPKLLKFKAPITAKYKTDFVVLNPMNELVLIEIEKPTTKLFKKNGDQHSELTHAFGQVEDWLTAGKRNRLALIDDINMDGLNIDNITNIRGVVIAGKNNEDYIGNFEKVRSRGNIDFYTYDDLLKSLVTIIRSYREL